MFDKVFSQRKVVTYGRIRRPYSTTPLTSLENDSHHSKRRRLEENEATISTCAIKQDANRSTICAPTFDILPDTHAADKQDGKSKALSSSDPNPKSKPILKKPSSFQITSRKIFSQVKRLQQSSKKRATPDRTVAMVLDSKVSLSAGQTKKKSKKPMTQMLLDFDGLGAPRITCKTCGMSYTPSLPEDAMIHKKFHAKSVGGVDFSLDVKADAKLWTSRGGNQQPASTRAVNPTSNSTARNLKSPSSSSVFLKRAKSTVTTEGKESTGYIIAIDDRSSPNEKKKAMEVLEVVNSELGSEKILESVLWGQPPSVKRKHGQDDTSLNSGQKGRYKVFLYITGRKCVGLCLAEKITTAVFMNTDTMSVDSKTDNQPLRASMGISRLWTCSSHRRAGVARRLLDCTTNHFYYGLEVGKEQVAFSMPTESGARFAMSWLSDGGDAPSTIPVYMD